MFFFFSATRISLIWVQLNGNLPPSYPLTVLYVSSRMIRMWKASAHLIILNKALKFSVTHQVALYMSLSLTICIWHRLTPSWPSCKRSAYFPPRPIPSLYHNHATKAGRPVHTWSIIIIWSMVNASSCATLRWTNIWPQMNIASSWWHSSLLAGIS